jgi:hypothetical protein
MEGKEALDITQHTQHTHLTVKAALIAALFQREGSPNLVPAAALPPLPWPAVALTPLLLLEVAPWLPAKVETPSILLRQAPNPKGHKFHGPDQRSGSAKDWINTGASSLAWLTLKLAILFLFIGTKTDNI